MSPIKFFPRELQKLDDSEEPGVFDVLAIDGDRYLYSPDVYDSESEALAAIEAFKLDYDQLDDWEETKHPGINDQGEYI